MGVFFVEEDKELYEALVFKTMAIHKTSPIAGRRDRKFRIHPDPYYKKIVFECAGHFISRELAKKIAKVSPNNISLTNIYTGIDEKDIMFLWAVDRINDAGKKPSKWAKSQNEGAQLAMENWITSGGVGEVPCVYKWEIVENIPPPLWPVFNFHDMFLKLFEERLVESREVLEKKLSVLQKRYTPYARSLMLLNNILKEI